MYVCLIVWCLSNIYQNFHFLNSWLINITLFKLKNVSFKIYTNMYNVHIYLVCFRISCCPSCCRHPRYVCLLHSSYVISFHFNFDFLLIRLSIDTCDRERYRTPIISNWFLYLLVQQCGSSISLTPNRPNILHVEIFPLYYKLITQ